MGRFAKAKPHVSMRATSECSLSAHSLTKRPNHQILFPVTRYTRLEPRRMPFCVFPRTAFRNSRILCKLALPLSVVIMKFRFISRHYVRFMICEAMNLVSVNPYHQTLHIYTTHFSTGKATTESCASFFLPATRPRRTPAVYGIQAATRGPPSLSA